MLPLETLKTLSKEEILKELPRLAGAEREQLVQLLDYLGELDERRAYLEAGYRSLWDYAQRALLFSEMQASLRTKAARLLRRLPLLRAPLADGRLSLCSLCALAPCVDDEDFAAMVQASAHKTKRQVEDLVAERHGKQTAQRDVIRRIGQEKTQQVGALSGAAADRAGTTVANASVGASHDLSRESPMIAAELFAPTTSGSAAASTEAAAARCGSDRETATGSAAASIKTPDAHGGVGRETTVESPVTAPAPDAHGSVGRETTVESPVTAPAAGTLAHAANATAVQRGPKAPKSHRISFSTGEDVAQKLRLLQDLLGAASLDEVIDRAAEALLEKVDPARRAARRQRRLEKRELEAKAISGNTTTPAAAKTSDLSAALAAEQAADLNTAPAPGNMPRRAPAAMADAIKLRDSCQCTYVSPDGTRCTARRHLEIDHQLAWAKGGETTIKNQRILCKNHNLMLARLDFPGKVPDRRPSA